MANGVKCHRFLVDQILCVMQLMFVFVILLVNSTTDLIVSLNLRITVPALKHHNVPMYPIYNVSRMNDVRCVLRLFFFSCFHLEIVAIVRAVHFGTEQLVVSFSFDVFSLKIILLINHFSVKETRMANM